MRNQNADMSAQQLHDALAHLADPVRIAYFTAPWCQPCSAFAPVIEQVAREAGGAVALYKINIDKYPDVAAAFGVRGVPSTVVLRTGAAEQRVVGAKSVSELRGWLTGHGIVLDDGHVAAPKRALVPARLQPFYGDVGLKNFLAQRVGQVLEDGQVRFAFRSYWADGAGTFSAALVHSADADIFERVTGLPFALACIIDFLDIRQRHDAERLFAALGPATELSSVSLRFAHAWLDCSEFGWSNALEAEGLDQLRRDWLAMAAQELAGNPPDPQAWDALRVRAKAALSNAGGGEGDPWRQLDDDVATMIAMLSPPPAPEDRRWQAIVSARMHFSRSRLLELRAGWTRREIALPILGLRWLQQHVTMRPDGKPDQDSLQEARVRNPYHDADAEERRSAFQARFEELSTPVNQLMLTRLIAIASGSGVAA